MTVEDGVDGPLTNWAVGSSLENGYIEVLETYDFVHFFKALRG